MYFLEKIYKKTAFLIAYNNKKLELNVLKLIFYFKTS